MDNIEFDNQPRFVNLSRGEVLVRFSKDDAGNVTITYNPDEMLTDEDRVIHFLDEPHGDKEYIEAKTKEIIEHYNLHEYIGAIKLESNSGNIIYFCGRLCEELLIHRFDCTKEDCRNMRDDELEKLKAKEILESGDLVVLAGGNKLLLNNWVKSQTELCNFSYHINLL